jgi:hypothetical protein
VPLFTLFSPVFFFQVPPFTMPFNLAAFFFLASAQVRGVCTRFTCFTGTNVQILTQQGLQGEGYF